MCGCAIRFGDNSVHLTETERWFVHRKEYAHQLKDKKLRHLREEKKSCGTREKSCGRTHFAATIFDLPNGLKKLRHAHQTDKKVAAGRNFEKKVAAD